jgi:hypothetical protein
MPCDRTTRNLSPSVALLTLSTVDFSLLTYSGRSSTTTSCRSSSKTSASCSDRCLPPPPPPLTSSLQLRSNDSGDYNYTEFLAPFDPSSTAPSGDQQQTKQPNPSLSYDCNVRDIDLWEEALRACKALDTEQCGFISQKRFLTILSKHLSGTGGISREEVKKILRQYRIGIGGKDLDYRSFFRSKLTTVLATEPMMLSSPNSVFQIDPGHQSRPTGASHPWDFSYRGHTAPSTHSSTSTSTALLQQTSSSAPNTSRAPSNTTAANTATATTERTGDRDPYWKRACAQPKTLSLPSSSSFPSTSASSPSLLLLKFQSPASAAVRPSEDLLPLLSLVKRLASHPQYRHLIENYKRNSLPSRVGFISNKHLLSSLRAIEFPMKKAEFNLLLKEFRAVGLPDTFHYQRMVDLAQAQGFS